MSRDIVLLRAKTVLGRRPDGVVRHGIQYLTGCFLPMPIWPVYRRAVARRDQSDEIRVMATQDWKHRANPGGGPFEDDHRRSSPIWSGSIWGLVTILAVLTALSWYWSREPEPIAVSGGSVVGFATTDALIKVTDTLLEKPGGYLSNDIFPPGLWLDNIPAWEYGVLIQARDMAKALREAFSRSRSQSTEDEDLAAAEPRYNFDNNSWMLPATESEYRQGRTYLAHYLSRLADQGESRAHFYARADNLRYWLGTVESRLGSLSQRLSASVGQQRINTDFAGEGEAQPLGSVADETLVKTSWMKLDNVFYEARGTTWALIQFLRAVDVDFAEVLDKKNARVNLRQIIRELEAVQEPLFSPVILNGSGFGILANHSLTAASYISRANAAIIDLRDLLAQG